MVSADKILAIEDARIWAVYHDAKSNAAWDQQWKDNIKMEDRMATIEGRLRVAERKIIWTTGAASMLGALLGSALTIALAFWKTS